MALKPIKPQTDLQLKHESPYYPKLPPNADIFEGVGQHLVVATADGQDLLFWTSFYIQLGRTPAGFLPDEAAVCHTMLFTVPATERGVMHDNDFMCPGWNPYEHLKLKELSVDSTRDAVTLKLRGAEFVCRPPHWEVRGSNKGIKHDLKITATAPTAWFLGDYEKVATVGRADFTQLTVSEGSIEVGGKTYRISRGYGTHEHPILCGVSMDTFTHPWHWFVGGGEELQFIVFAWDVPSKMYGRVMVDGKFVGQDADITLTTLETWVDPRSLVAMPCKWHINMRSAEGIFDVHLAASGRANRIWCLRNGYLWDTWFLGTANGSFMYPDGRMIPIKDMLFGLEWARTILR